ncbi:MAG TPA: shikimate dehydrogenase [Gaiellaceae bacterium]|nr:shikimate dehydrogenase [Gaiellaceae bacterium]
MTHVSATTTLVGILGWPVSHSLSPPMQNAAFAALGLDWVYVPLPAPPERLAEAVRGLAATGFAGANVTIPHKSAVVDLCDEVEEAAARAGSVNTLAFQDGRVQGSSTDVVALERAVAGASGRALVLGAGGSAKAAVAALARLEVEVVGRRDPGWPPDASGYDVVVNATPVRDDPLVRPAAGQTVVDLPYNPDGSPTALARAAREAGARVVDGLELLLWQGAASFERWTGRPAPLEAMRAALPGRAP